MTTTRDISRRLRRRSRGSKLSAAIMTVCGVVVVVIEELLYGGIAP